MKNHSNYAVAVRRDFIAQHYLIGGDWGPENDLHSHHYIVEMRLEGRDLDRHGYLVDIDAAFAALDKQIDRFRDRTLNDLPEFEDLNPSLEHLARIICESLSAAVGQSLQALTVRIWENSLAWAEHRLTF